MAAFVLRMNESTPAVVRFSNITQTRIRAWPARPEICLYNDSSPNLRRRDGRVAEGARLESVFRGNSNVGSNPTLSAILYVVDLIMLILAEEIKVTLSTSYLYFQ